LFQCCAASITFAGRVAAQVPSLCAGHHEHYALTAGATMLERPAGVAARPKCKETRSSVLTTCSIVRTQLSVMPLDVLSDVLRAIRLSGVVYFDFTVTPPWVAEAPPSREIAGTVLPGSERVIEYHLILAGTAWGHAVGDAPIYLREGDLLLFPQGDAHVLSSAPGMRSAPELSIYARSSTPLPLVYELGTGSGEGRARFICGFFGCDEGPYNPLLTSLPAVIHLPAAGPNVTARPLGAMLELAIREERRGQPGTENVLSRLSELMLVEAIRRYLVELPGTQRSWLAGLRDPVVGRALEVMHSTPCDPWTIESLGRTIGVSRSVLAARFTEMVGHPPIHYLTLWRMQLASRMLHDGQQVSEVAKAVATSPKPPSVAHSRNRWAHRQ
jgi:AraC-like DNA-binding protein